MRWGCQRVLLTKQTLMPAHMTLLAMLSPVFADMQSCKAEAEADSLWDRKMSSFLIPLPGNTLAEISTVLKYIYQRAVLPVTDAPSRNLWESFETTHAVATFAHKFNMQTILLEIDDALTEAAQSKTRLETSCCIPHLCDDAECAIEWAALAEQFQLNSFLAHVEAFIVQCPDLKFWMDKDIPVDKLSRGCLQRLLRAQQHLAVGRAAVGNSNSGGPQGAFSFDYRPGLEGFENYLGGVSTLSKWKQEQDA